MILKNKREMLKKNNQLKVNQNKNLKIQIRIVELKDH